MYEYNEEKLIFPLTKATALTITPFGTQNEGSKSLLLFYAGGFAGPQWFCVLILNNMAVFSV